MNVFEFLWAIAIVGGGVAGGAKGYAIHGASGAALGVIVGACGGLAVAFTLTFLTAALMSLATKRPLFRPKPPERPV